RKSFESIARFHHRHPDRPLIVTLTGTDLYEDIHRSAEARQSMEWATRLVVLQPLGIKALPTHLREKARVIIQSAVCPPGDHRPHVRVFEICVIGHLRPVKDPFRTAWAVRLLPPTSRIRVLHLGGALDDAMAEQARAEMAVNPRYRWLGDQPRWKTLRILARARLLCHTSWKEGGANVVSEAIATATPVLASRIPGNVGLLGEDYAGYFPPGDTEALADLLARVERDSVFYQTLQRQIRARAPLVDPARERNQWARLLQEVIR
ncbi:TPA: TIGR04348 family glycosyltransferase, partial [Candidatus Micrarchaeota archaeon]|nr:TIGR04348 family glycosyltransferase [Candidatus Micrarchaeota archaeon]